MTRFLRVTCLVAAVAAGGHAVLHAHDTFSLVTSFGSVWDGSACASGHGLCSDSSAPYRDLVNGVDSWAEAHGNIQLRTTASATRTICYSFSEGPTAIHDAGSFSRFVPAGGLSGCYPASFTTLANGEYGATDIGHEQPSPSPISAFSYFFAGDLQYELHWKRQGVTGLTSSAPPLKVTSDAVTWFLQPYDASDDTLTITDTCPNCQYVPPDCPEHCATLAVFSNNKPRGRIFLANYVMPFALTADTDPVNQRTRGKKM